MIDPDDLLQTAAVLALPDRARRDADLRRAVSTAYYALFHALSRLVADGLALPGGVEWVRAYRALDHRPMRDACRAGANEDLGPEPETVARVFIELQQRRQGADYDPIRAPTPDEAWEAVTLAARALDALARLDAPTRRAFALRLLLKERPR